MFKTKNKNKRISVLLFGLLLVDDVKHLLFYGFLFQGQTVLVPNEVWVFGVVRMPFHALLHQSDNVRVIGILSERHIPTILHKL